MRRLLLPLLLLVFAAPTAAQPPTSAEARNARIDTLTERAVVRLGTLAQPERREAAYRLARVLVELGRCAAAERLSTEQSLVPGGLVWSANSVALTSDRACADRLITSLAQSATETGEAGPMMGRLYHAGALWRRIGEGDKADVAIDEADRYFAERESRDSLGEWICHGGNCLSQLWVERLGALQVYRGSSYYNAELRWLAAQALAHRYAHEARRSAAMTSQRLFEELLAHAVDAGDDGLARLLAEETVYGYPAAYAGERMRQLLEAGRVEEALELWPTAGAAFHAPITPAAFRANLPLFHRWREQLRTRHWRQPGEWLSLLPAVWVERAEHERAREALATARAHHVATRGYEWDLEYVQRLLAVEAMLEGGADPVGWLSRHPFPTSEFSLERDYAFGELAALLAATNRQAEIRRAFDAIHDPRVRQSRLVELPCRAAYGGDAAAAFAVGLARGHLRPRDRTEDEVNRFNGASYQTFLCLVRAGRGDAATVYAQAIDDPRRRLSLFVNFPGDSGIADEMQLRRRFAGLALTLAARHDLWGDGAIPYLAAQLERAGDFAGVERVLARARGGARVSVHEQVLRTYLPARS